MSSKCQQQRWGLVHPALTTTATLHLDLLLPAQASRSLSSGQAAHQQCGNLLLLQCQLLHLQQSH
jgi:hypothetical protein